MQAPAGGREDSGGISEIHDAASRLANATGSVVVMSGATDIITDGTDAILVNGHPLMGAPTGCMASRSLDRSRLSRTTMISSAAALVAFGIAEWAARNAIGPSFKIAIGCGGALKPET